MENHAIKIAFLLGSLNRGGAEMLALDIFREAKKESLDLILVHRKKGKLFDDFKKCLWPIYYLKLKHHFDLSYIFRLRSLIKQQQITIVHAHQVIDALLGKLATIGLPVNLVLTMHGHGINEGFLSRTLRQIALNITHKNLYVSQSLLKFYYKKFRLRNKIKNQLCYNGISFEKFNQKRNPSLVNKNIKIAMVGNFTSVRDQATVCRFLNLLDENNIDFTFLFVGAKSNSEYWLYENCIELLKHLVDKKKVKFMGSRKDIPEILIQQDAFIYSSAHDTFGIAVIEAMYVGIPLFLNDWEVMTEITDGGKHATIYRSKDEYDLLNKFNHFLENRKEYETKAILAKEFVEKNYSIQSHIQNLKKTYQSIQKD